MSCEATTPAQRERLRNQKINEKKLTIASLSSAIVSDPFSSVRLGAGLGSVSGTCFQCV